jgi:hypothetical protein
MSCQLNSDPSGIRKFSAAAGSQVAMHIESTSTSAKLSAATLNDNALTITNDASITFTVAAGMNVLLITTVSPSVADTIQVFEDCGAGQQKKIDEYPYDPNDPARGYRISGTSGGA